MFSRVNCGLSRSRSVYWALVGGRGVEPVIPFFLPLSENEFLDR